jgi:hypothetical protein
VEFPVLEEKTAAEAVHTQGSFRSFLSAPILACLDSGDALGSKQ